MTAVAALDSKQPQASQVPTDIYVKGLKKSFGQSAQILKGVDFSISRGEAVSLLGSNGSGKSTLLRCCLLLIQPDAGEIDILGRKVSFSSRSELQKLRAEIGFVAQRHNLVPRLSALTNVLHGALAYDRSPRNWFQGFASRRERSKAMHCLELVGLPHIASRRVEKLSGGQSQRVAIARALMQDPKIIIADEPVASLDPNAGDEVMELFVKLIREKGITLLFTSHHLEHALKFSERILGLRDGKIVLNDPSSSMDVSRLREFYE